VLNVPIPLFAFISNNENETLLLEFVYFCVFFLLMCVRTYVHTCVCMYVCMKVFIYALFKVAASSQVPATLSSWPISR